jgi:tagatose-6-phosphate ketose/aldose isomerase
LNPVRVSDRLQLLVNASEAEKQAMGTRFTPQEILQQPATWPKTYARCAARAPALRDFLGRSGIGSPISGTGGKLLPTVFLVGAGSSDYIGRALAPLLRQLWKCEAWAVPSTDLLTNLEDLVSPDCNYLWISVSRSGDSPEGLAVLETAIQRYPGIRHLLITCNTNGRMAAACAQAPERSFVLTLDEAVNDRGLAMTSSFTNMLVAGQCAAHAYSLDRYEPVISMLSEAGAGFLERAQEVAAAIVQEEFSRACFVGSGTLHAVAQESALKLVELTAGTIATMWESTMGLRHGPMSALNKDTLFVALVSRQPRRRSYEIDLLKEIKSKQLGKLRVAVTPDRADSLNSCADHVLSLEAPQLADEYRGPVDVILGQLLGLFSSLRFGLKPDSPSPNGAISRVVSNVNIYS